jgi:uncharacterized protein (DUF608 family)
MTIINSTMKRTIYLLTILLPLVYSCNNSTVGTDGTTSRGFNEKYTGKYLEHIAFPIGGIGAGMICLEGTGAISHVSVYNKPDVFNEPCMFAAISVKGFDNGAKVIEGPVPDYKVFGRPLTARGAPRTSYGLPRFENAEFEARFPFVVNLNDVDLPLKVTVTGWSPFIPLDEDNSSLPCGALEYTFLNTSNKEVEATFSYNTVNFMSQPLSKNNVRPISNGFILSNDGTEEEPYLKGAFAIFTDDNTTLVDHCWFRGTWYDPLSITWKHIQENSARVIEPVENGAPGASLYVPFTLKPGEEKTVKLMMSWYVPDTKLRTGSDLYAADTPLGEPSESCCEAPYYRPWYSSKFKNINEVAYYWLNNYEDLRRKSELFRNTFYSSTLPVEVIEAVAANLTILKSPTVLRQYDGKLWCWEGCNDEAGCCAGSCTHVWNYAQAIPHLFPGLERSLRETEFTTNQNDLGHQTFRAALPIREVDHSFYAAADGQLGGIMKVYRDWRISGDDQWLKQIYPQVKLSLDYCIKEWDPRETGTLEEPHHNTYDIEFWGPNGMCTSFYLGALKAAILMGDYLGEPTQSYLTLLDKGVKMMQDSLFNGEYFIQKIKTEGLNSPPPVDVAGRSLRSTYSEEAKVLLSKEGPKYQYGNGCLSDGILGIWIAKVCGIDEPIIDEKLLRSHLNSVYKYNFKTDLSDHSNPQRPTYALGKDGGLLICSWPHGDALTLPFVYSNEVWTGIEYQVASHLMFIGMQKEALDIVKACRTRYDGRVRNPFDEYECGHWYARAMSSYGMIQGITGVRYDAVTKTLYYDSKMGDDFKTFFSCQTGYGLVGMENGNPFVQMTVGSMDIKKCIVSGSEIDLGKLKTL